LAFYKNTPSQQTIPAGNTKVNARIFIFLWCLCAAAFLWVMIVLNNNYTSKITYTLFYGKEKKTVTVRVHGNGFELLKEKFTLKRIVTDKKYIEDTESFIFNKMMMNEHLKYESFKPSNLSF
jgi:hypothetical protein